MFLNIGYTILLVHILRDKVFTTLYLNSIITLATCLAVMFMLVNYNNIRNDLFACFAAVILASSHQVHRVLRLNSTLPSAIYSWK